MAVSLKMAPAVGWREEPRNPERTFQIGRRDEWVSYCQGPIPGSTSSEVLSATTSDALSLLTRYYTLLFRINALRGQQKLSLGWRRLIWRLFGYIGVRYCNNNVSMCKRKHIKIMIIKVSKFFFFGALPFQPSIY